MSRLLTLDAKVRVLRGDQHYWRVIREVNERDGSWTVSAIDALSNGDRKHVHDFVRRLVAGGYAEVVSQHATTKAQSYRLVRTSRDAPRLTRAGVELAEPLQETLWRTMKLLKTFTAVELAHAAATDGRPAHPGTTDSYCRRLAAAGVLGRAVAGAPGRPARYRLVLAGLGPIAPKVLATKLVFDANGRRILGVAETKEAS